MTDPIFDLVIADLRKREAQGAETYGKARMEAHDGRDSLVDLYEELLDAVAYLRKAIAERVPLPSPCFWPDDCPHCDGSDAMPEPDGAAYAKKTIVEREQGGKVDARALIKFWRESLTELERHENDRDERLRLAEAVCLLLVADPGLLTTSGRVQRAVEEWQRRDELKFAENAPREATAGLVRDAYSDEELRFLQVLDSAPKPESDEDYARRMGWQERGGVWRRQKRSKGYWPFIEHRHWRLVPTADTPITKHPTLRAAVDAYAAQNDKSLAQALAEVGEDSVD